MDRVYIARPLYLEKVTPYLGKDVIKVFVGQRRVGKSYMLLQVMDLVKRHDPSVSVVSINKELHDFSFIRTADDLVRYVRSQVPGTGRAVLFIDEVQEIEGFEKALRSLNAEGRYDIYCTGSNARLLSGDLATHLAGRAVEIRLHGLSYLEFLEFHGMEDGRASLDLYLRYGGLPYLRNLELEDAVVFDYLRNIYSAILYRDVVARHAIRNVTFLENLVAYLADNTGSIVSAKKISDFLRSQNVRMSPGIVIDYLSYLTDAFFVSRVPRADVAGKKVFEIGEKYYFGDLGLRHAVGGFRVTDMGKIVENAVYAHLRVAGYAVTVGRLGAREIDFVCERAGERMYVQAAYLLADDVTREREFGNLLAVEDNYPKVVVSMDEERGGSFRGIEHLYLGDFFKEVK